MTYVMLLSSVEIAAQTFKANALTNCPPFVQKFEVFLGKSTVKKELLKKIDYYRSLNCY